MRNLMRWACAALATFLALAVLMPTAAVALTVDTRLVVPGGTANTTKILPGGAAIFEVRIDAPAVSTIGTTYRLEQTNPLLPTGFFSITGRSIVGSPYNDPSFGATDAQATAAPGNLLDPDNDVNLGKQTVGRVPIPPAINILATTIGLTSDPLTPLGTYRIQATVGSTVTETTTTPPPVGTDWPMNFAFFDIVVGQTLTVTKSGSGTGTVTANSGLINCGATCSDIYPGTAVNLTASASPGSVFTGWSGAGCSGTGTCSVTVGAAQTVNAIFGGTTGTPAVLTGAVSRKTHGAGVFDLPLSLVSTDPTTEPRLGPAQTIVFDFNKAVVSGLAAVTEGTAGIGSVTVAGNQMTVSLTGVNDQQYVTVAVSNVVAADGGTGGNGTVRIGFLVGDVNGSRSVNSTDILAVKASSGAAASALNFKSDLNASGFINSTDILAVKAFSGHVLPLP